MTQPQSPTSLYRLYAADGALLYIGIAGNPGRRFEQHKGEKPWWGEVDRITLEHFQARELAAKAEVAAIKNEHPSYNKSSVVSGLTIPLPPQALTGHRTWTFQSRKTGYERSIPLYLYWEVEGDPLTDNWMPEEIDAYSLWDMWIEDLPSDPTSVAISWFVCSKGNNGVFEGAPFRPNDKLGNFLTYFTWPYDDITHEALNWLTLPVVDKRWTPDQGDKGGFIQEVTGWKPSPLQPSVDVVLLAQAAQLTRPSNTTKA